MLQKTAQIDGGNHKISPITTRAPDSTRRRRQEDHKNDERQTRPRGRALDDPDLIFPCGHCMCLAATNRNCKRCAFEHQLHYDKLLDSKLLPNLGKDNYTILPSFPCPCPINYNGVLCEGAISPEHLGLGKCPACKALRNYFVRMHRGDDTEPKRPYHHVLVIG